MEEQLRSLKLKQADLFSQLEMLSEVSAAFYQKIGKITADIHVLEKKILRTTENELQA